MVKEHSAGLQRFWCAIAMIAFLAGAAYLTRGFLSYFRAPPYRNLPQPIDAQRRWREVHYVMRGRNPYDVLFAHDPAFRGVPAGTGPAGRDSDVMDDLGIPDGVVYPPWAFPSEAIFFWPGSRWHFVYYGLWMFVGIMATAAWGANEMRVAGGSRLAAAAMGLSILACAAWAGR